MQASKPRVRVVVGGAVLAGVFTAGLLNGGKASAATLFDSGGFESYSLGNLVGQNTFLTDTGLTTGSATVESTVTKSGGKAVELDKGINKPNGVDQDSRHYYPSHSVVTPSSVLVNWDMDAVATNDPNNPYGPFFGMELYGGATRIGAFGIDASTGELEAEFIENGVTAIDILPSDASTTLGAFHNYQVSLNYTAQTYSIYLDGTLEDTVPFLAATTGFSDADLSGLENDANSNPAGTAYFDNYVVTYSAVPEPVSLGLVLPAAAMVLRRRARRA